MKVISVIEDEEIIKKILKHLGLWEVKPQPPPKAAEPQKTPECSMDYSVSQLPTPARRLSGGSDNLSRASRSNEWLYVDPEYPGAYPG